MTKQQKSEVIDFLTNEFKGSQAIVVCDYKGLTHKEIESLKKDAKASDVKVQVAKNTLATIAVKNANLGDIELKGTNIFLWSEDQISACKVADKFATSHSDKFVIKSGIIEGALADLDKINAFAKLLSKEELIGMLLSVWTAPLRNFVTGLDNLKTKKEEAA